MQDIKINIKWKYVPYIAILIFTTIVSIIRYYMIPEWTADIHITLFFTQFIFLSCIWLMIKALSDYLDKKIPFSKNVRKRLFVQIFTSLLLFAPLFILLVELSKPYLPGFANHQFLALATVLVIVMIVLLNLGLSAYYFFRQWQQSVEEKAACRLRRLNWKKINRSCNIIIFETR